MGSRLTGYGERRVDEATVRDFPAIAREADARADRNERQAAPIVARALALGTTVEKLAALGLDPAVGALTLLRFAAADRRLARASRMAAARWKHRPHVVATETWNARGIESAAAPAVAVMLSWATAVAELVPNMTERLPYPHGPPVRQLTDVHAPLCGVPAPPPCGARRAWTL